MPHTRRHLPRSRPIHALTGQSCFGGTSRADTILGRFNWVFYVAEVLHSQAVFAWNFVLATNYNNFETDWLLVLGKKTTLCAVFFFFFILTLPFLWRLVLMDRSSAHRAFACICYLRSVGLFMHFLIRLYIVAWYVLCHNSSCTLFPQTLRKISSRHLFYSLATPKWFNHQITLMLM